MLPLTMFVCWLFNVLLFNIPVVGLPKSFSFLPFWMFFHCIHYTILGETAPNPIVTFKFLYMYSYKIGEFHCELSYQAFGYFLIF